MAIRRPVANGKFYPDGREALRAETGKWLAAGEAQAGLALQFSQNPSKPWGVMLPHAGYVYCGNVIGQTLAGQTLPERLVVLCPNHTGQGKALGVWNEGKWLTPAGLASVDESLARAIMEENAGFEPDFFSHLGEHSIETLLPFLHELFREPLIVPIAVGTHDPRALFDAGRALSRVLVRRENEDVGVVVSSDMNHYEDQRVTLAKDNLALERALGCDPDGLLAVTKRENISMCGAAPLALALYAAGELGGATVRLIAHETSANVTGDFEHTVGYAGLRIFLDREKR